MLKEDERMKRIGQWIENLSFLRKIVLIYIIGGILPIMGMLIYFFFNTYHLLLQQSYDEMNQQMIVAESSLNSALQPYKDIIENIKNDRKPNIQLNADYSKLSYSELAYFLNTTIDNWKAIHSDIRAIRFYTNNNTLPSDGYYFYGIDDLDTNIIKRLDENKENVLFFDKHQKDEDNYALISEMNYYIFGEKKAYVELELSGSLLNNLFYSQTEGRESYLVNSKGEMVYASDEKLYKKKMSYLVPDWEEVKDSTIQSFSKADGQRIICLRKQLDEDMYLFMLDDQNKMIRDALRTPSILALVGLLLTIFFFSIITYYGRRWDRRIKTIIAGMNRIGSGDFSYKFNPKTKEEFGQIETAINTMSIQIDELIQENYQKQLLMKSTELNLLQEQIKPHFLYNALGLISSLSIQEGARRSYQSIKYLADFYRISLNKGRKIISVSEEFALLKDYMKIQMLRFPDHVEIEYDIQEEIKDLYMIKLLLQPLVENAIHHAREEDIFLTINVKAYNKSDRVCFDVIDNGMGIEKEKLKLLQEALLRQEEGFGLKNVDRRIKLNYGPEYGVTIYSVQGEGTRIHLEIPACKTPDEYRKL